MPVQKYFFRAQKNPTAKELHCLWAHLTDKQHQQQHDIAFKVFANGKQVQVFAAVPLVEGDILLATNGFAFLRKEDVVLSTYSAGQFVRLQGSFAYSVHSFTSKKEECPVDAFGRIKPHLRAAFVKRLTQETGVDVAQALQLGSAKFAWESRSVPADKVWLNDVITFSLTGAVIAPEKTNSLAVRAIGRRKSYGMGCVVVTEEATAEHFESTAGTAVE